jgi:hypothetical protein
MRKHKRRLYASKSHTTSLLLDLQNELKLFEEHFAKVTVKVKARRWPLNKVVLHYPA